MYGDCQVVASMSSSMVGGGGGGGGGSAGGGMISTMALSPDSLFSSPPTVPNPSATSHLGIPFFSGMPPFHAFSTIVPKEEVGMGMLGMRMGKEEEMESGSGSGHVDGVSAGEDQSNEGSFRQQLMQPMDGKKKRYHRHTARQIQEMEELFKECPHPDDKQRLKLSQELGLKPRQVKFWFQNRRTQMKAQQDRSDNVMLRAEYEGLKSENFRLQAAIRNVACPTCGGPAILGEMSFDEQHLRIENARLKDELDRVSCIVARYSNRGLPPPPPILMPSLDLDMGIYSRHFVEAPMGGCDDMVPALPAISDGQQTFHGVLIGDHDKQLVLDLAMTAANQLVRMCATNEPLWVRCGGVGVVSEVLNLEEHARMFPWPVDVQPQGGDFRTEATRDSAMVFLNSISLVDAFLDPIKWMDLFPSIVSKARTVQIISSGISGHGNGSLHLMYAELHFLSPLVPTRETHFFRYCQQNAEEGTWTVVDFPVDGFQDSLQVTLPQYRRRPSGCVIQDMPNGYSRVMWVEHGEIEDKPVHQIFSQFISSGAAFGATRWLSVLHRQCERLAILNARNINLGVIPSAEARNNMMKLSQRMIRIFCSNISYSAVQSWTALSDSSDDTIRVTTRKNTGPGEPNGVILSSASTTWLPYPHQLVFELLADEQRRPQLEVLPPGNTLHEVAHIPIGSHPHNCVSLLRVNAASNSSQNVELLLQESSTHASGGSLIVYASMDVDSIQVAMSGEDPSYIPLLPSGFIISPSAGRSSSSSDGGSSSNAVIPLIPSTGCLLTVAMQVLTSAVPSAKLNLSSVTAINNHITNIVHNVTAALSGGGEQPPPSPEQ